MPAQTPQNGTIDQLTRPYRISSTPKRIYLLGSAADVVRLPIGDFERRASHVSTSLPATIVPEGRVVDDSRGFPRPGPSLFSREGIAGGNIGKYYWIKLTETRTAVRVYLAYHGPFSQPPLVRDAAAKPIIASTEPYKAA
jgi:hypothetical protein